METYTFVNIFETKGAEYLLVIAFLLLFIVFVRYLGFGGSGEAHEGHAPAGGDERHADGPLA
jgi:hypothetical protein